LAKEHFSVQDNANKSALLFKKSVRCVEIEISSYCNRICTYCPNVFIDRRSENIFIDDGVFLNIIESLARINYSNVIRLNRYNEPLSDRDYYLKRMKQVRKTLPNARLELFTNGDYFNHDFVETLYNNGCRGIHATAHHDWASYTREKGEAYLIKLIEKLGYEYTITKSEESITSCEVYVRKDMKFTYNILNFMGNDEAGIPLANDRGQSLDIATEYKRTSPCLRQFEELSIDHNGNVVPCCHIRSDIPDHKNFGMGEIGKDNNIFLLWCNKKFAGWRRNMISYDLKNDPCTTCDYMLVGENKKLVHWNDHLKSRQLTSPNS